MKRSIIVLLLICCLSLMSCSNEASSTTPESAQGMSVEVEKSLLTTEEFTSLYPTIIYGTCTSLRQEEISGITTYCFDIAVKKTLAGSIKKDVIEFRNYECLLKAGEEYFLGIEPVADVFSGEDYYIGTVVFSPSQEKTPGNVLLPDSVKTTEDLEKELVRCAAVSPYAGNDEIMGDYIRSEDPLEIAGQSEIILSATVTAIENAAANDRIWVSCEVKKIIKGKPDSMHITAILPVGSVEEGDDYLLMLQHVDKNSTFLIVTSRNSVFPADSETAKLLTH